MQNTNTPTPMNLNQVLTAALNTGVVKFWFTKIDGTKRVAIGTRNPHILELTGGTPQGNGDRREANPTLTCYYDFGKGSWRCFKNQLAGGIIFEKMSNEQVAAEILAEGRANGEDELARTTASKFVPQESVRAMFSALLQGKSTDEVVAAAVSVSRPAAPSSTSAPSGHAAPSKAELLDELCRLQKRQNEILKLLTE